MLGKIVLEEAYERAGLEEHSKREASLYVAPWDRERYMRQIHDINREHLQLSNEHGIGYMFVSLTVPEIQGITVEQIKDHRDRLGPFVCLSMHFQAGQKIRRCVKHLSFHGALLCDFQHDGPNGEIYLFYGQPQYDAFWKVLTDLNVPLYIHPAAKKSKLIFGHQEEHIPFGFWRLNNWFEDIEKPVANEKGKIMCKKTIYDYSKQNI
ncbi:uncharacterized protein CDV56_105388 [Aspergillus thermomutatus]|uniref:Uncharacterized protein n=1 Tax=Aspergillus thermomutatus TaxID=41047 RepID=A0A397HFQ8_ASPTH|nr:uncharacterized protein CDV56_105388 [Aspergillus thermomutatus]RHZ60103.1 hypothetical protein CDV56_105388 [Aspergillus thermomutatus]